MKTQGKRRKDKLYFQKEGYQIIISNMILMMYIVEVVDEFLYLGVNFR
jgi:hypothetical protein